MAGAETEGRKWLLTDSLPMYVRLVDDVEDLQLYKLPDSTFNRIAGSTIFIVNRTELNTNDPWVRELTESVLPFANAYQLALVGIELRGAASPEGPYWNNVRLSVGRAKALRDFVTSKCDSVALVDWLTTTTPEDYPRLLWMMEQRNDPDTELLRQIMDECGHDNDGAIKSRLQKVNGGATWRRLLRDIFPELRAARIVLLMKRTNPKVPITSIYNVIPEPEELVIDYTQQIPEAVLPMLPRPRKHMLSVSSNLLYDAFYMPNFGWAPMVNVGVEWYPKHGNWTVRGAFMWPYYHRWSKCKFFQIRDYHLEVRRYFNPGWWHTGLYAAAYVNATKYGIGFDKYKGWKGEGIGGAVKLGYELPLGKGNWRLDFHIAGGVWHTRYDPYVFFNPLTGEEDGLYYYRWYGLKEDFKRRNYKLTWVGPTEAGITLTFDVLYYRRK